jgi:hypothetical protein
LVVHDARQEPLLQMRRPAGHSLSALQRCSPQYRPKSPDWQVSTVEQLADVVQLCADALPPPSVDKITPATNVNLIIQDMGRPSQ